MKTNNMGRALDLAGEDCGRIEVFIRGDSEPLGVLVSEAELRELAAGELWQVICDSMLDVFRAPNGALGIFRHRHQ